ncbi:tetratricopeptide repeat protein [Geodermatophilus obscurus]|uniref:tetratricopeptide repeat protein n=1 Tax=Geodermatophilus obscurus TaxID=1861 RepID=UPI001FCBA444|nr:tetratricopeptide repeat protein [Geodermatophilus obscurus]
MRRPLTGDEVEDLYARARTPEQHRAAAEKLAAWAEEAHPEDQDVSPASLLVSAGEHLTEAGDLEGAVALFRRAVATGQHVPPDVRCYLHGGMLRLGDAEAARRIAEELRRERPVDGDVYLFLGENHELAGDLREAHRWLTMGARRAFGDIEDGDDRAVEDAAGLLMARLRVRHALGLPLDEYDTLVASALLDERSTSG